MRMHNKVRVCAVVFAFCGLSVFSCKARKSSALQSNVQDSSGNCIFPTDAKQSKYIGVVLENDDGGAKVVCMQSGVGFHQAHRMQLGDVIVGLNQGRKVASVADFEHQADEVRGDANIAGSAWEFHVRRDGADLVLLPIAKYDSCTFSSPASCGP